MYEETNTKQIESCEETKDSSTREEQKVQSWIERVSVPSYEGIYEVDTDWTVYSIRKRTRQWAVIGDERKPMNPRIKRYKSGRVVYCVTLYHPERRKRHYSLAKLVYWSFNGLSLKHRDNKAIIHMMDWNSLNCKLSNLKQMTFAEWKQMSIYEQRRG